MTNQADPTPDNKAQLPDRARWRHQPLQGRLSAVIAMFIEHESVVEILKFIKQELILCKIKGESSAALVIAPSGAGKSRLIEYLQKLYLNSDTETQSIRPVIRFKIPKVLTLAGMGEALLRALGDPMPKVGNAEDKINRASALLKSCQTIIIAIDDFQDVPEKRHEEGIQEIGGWVRDLITEHFDGVVLAFGTEPAAIVRDSNQQLRRRMQARLELPDFVMGTADQKKRFKALMKAIDAKLPLAESSQLDTAVLLRPMQRATAGNLDYIMKLLTKAVMLAVARGSERIDRADLAAAFVEQHRVAAHNGNPFDEDFPDVPLDEPGQIFFKAKAEEKPRKRKPGVSGQ